MNTINEKKEILSAAIAAKEKLDVLISMLEVSIINLDAFEPLFQRKVDDLEFTVRIQNALKEYTEVKYIGDLVELTENELSKIPNLGKTSLNEIRDVLASKNLKSGTRIDGWAMYRSKLELVELK